MQLISYLQEAADIPLADLRALVKKDKRVNKIFTKNLQLDEIVDPKEFIQTLRFYVLNNRHVLEFIKQRSGVSKYVSDWWFKQSRQLRPEQLTQKELETLQSNVTDFFRDLTSVTNVTISNDSFQSLWGWLSSSPGHRHGIAGRVARELQSMPSLRPTTATRLYRGLSFNAQSLIERDTGDGTMDVGSGLKFLRSIREGSRVADVVYDEPSVWYRDKERAVSDAFHGDRGRYRDGRHKIADQLAFVISVLAQPEEIIVDTALIPKVEHSEPAVVLEAGKYTVRVVHKYTETGEVDPTAKPDEQSDVVSTIESLEMFAHVFKPSLPEPQFDSIDRGSWDSERLENFKLMMEPSSKEKIIKNYDTLIEFYNTYLKDVTPTQLNDLAADVKHGKASQVAKWLIDFMQEKEQHPTKKDAGYRADRRLWMPRNEMTGEELWTGNSTNSLRELIPFMLKPTRFTTWNTGGMVNNLLRMTGKPSVKDMHRAAGKIQQKHIQEAIDSFYEAMGIPRPADNTEAVNKLNTMVNTAERNARMLTRLWNVRDNLNKLKD